MRVRLIAAAAAVLMLTAGAYASSAGASPNETAPHSAAVHLGNGGPAHGDGNGKQRPGSGGSGSTSNGINYHGGPVMNSPINVYIIWYGNWSGDSSTTLLPTMLNNIGASPYFHIQSTYTDSLHRPVSSAITVAKQTTDAYSQGSKNLSDTQIATIVSTALNKKSLPADPNGVYFVLTSKDVTKSGFLTSYCGWHTDGNYGTTNIKYSFVGDPGSNGACSVQTSVSPNGNVGADAMASVVAHELDEATNDPDLNAWYDQRGQESADKCAWTFGTTYAANGAQANMKLGGLNFLIQRNWVNASGGYCALSY